MATEKTAKPITLGEVECKRLVFTTGIRTGPNTASGMYVAGADGMDLLEFWKVYGHDAKRVEVIDSNDTGKHWYALAVQDCFDPPVCIVRADGPSEAEERFLSEKDWADVSEPDLKDYKRDPDGRDCYQDLTYTDRGTWADTESIYVGEVALLRAEF